jgi:flagellar assembly protein FliH
MAKAVFRPGELVTLTDKIVIDSPTSYPEMAHLMPVEEVVEAVDDIEVYAGPTADDLRREAEAYKAHWEEEKERMHSTARVQAESIIKDAEEAAFQEIKRQTDEGQVLKQQAEEEAERIIADAQARAAEIENEARKTLRNDRNEAQQKGREEGHETGFAEGKAEVERLIERTQVMLERAQDKRAEILAETEQEIIDLVLLIARKVIKVISENQRNVIVSNVVQALRKVKARGNIIIRVNMSDLKLATDYKSEFIKLIEGAKSIQVQEDSSVDSGGCIIETDFGEIDARISSQLAELESKILEISPIKSKIRSEPPQLNRATDLAVTAAIMQENEKQVQEADDDLLPEANAALTASAALAALTTMAMKGKRDSDKEMMAGIDTVRQRSTD